MQMDEVFDVVVVGFGYAGGMAAVAARDCGASVVLLEKAAAPGGISICSAGGVRYAADEEKVAAYLERTCAGTTPKHVLRTLAAGMASLPKQLSAMAAVTGAELSIEPAAGNYPLPGFDGFGFVNVVSLDGFDPVRAYPHVRGSRNGALLFKMLADNVAKRGIAVLCDTAARRLLMASDGDVSGVEVLWEGAIRRIGARRAVILACGGFEGNHEMQRQHWPEGPVASAAYRLNTGDGIRMGQALGADLWHMWHYHGSYGYRHPDPAYPYAIRVKRLPDWRPGDDRELPRMAWILLDRTGRRFMNEYEPYMQDTGHRPLAVFDPASQDYPRVPAFLVVDEVGRRLYPLGRPTYNDPDVAFDWSDDNLAEVALGIFTRVATTAELAAVIGVGPEVVTAEIERWNAACHNAVDEHFGRPKASMMPLENPPLYVARVHPLVSNTQGGLVHDCLHRVLRVDGAPIRRLFAAGEITSVFGHLYLSGGNLAECFVGGQIAGRAAADVPLLAGDSQAGVEVGICAGAED